MKTPRSKLRGIKTSKGRTRKIGNEASFGESHPQRLKPKDAAMTELVIRARASGGPEKLTDEFIAAFKKESQ